MASRPTTSAHHESFASAAAAATANGRAPPQSMQLPNVPKMTDERSRGKYVAEYDRYEQELRKHHLGPAETTTTAGLKDLPTGFNRRVPLLTEPTAAEKDYEHMQRVLNARKKKEQRLHNITGTKSTRASQRAKSTSSAATMPAATSKNSLSAPASVMLMSGGSSSSATPSAATFTPPSPPAATAAPVAAAERAMAAPTSAMRPSPPTGANSAAAPPHAQPQTQRGQRGKSTFTTGEAAEARPPRTTSSVIVTAPSAHEAPSSGLLKRAGRPADVCAPESQLKGSHARMDVNADAMKRAAAVLPAPNRSGRSGASPARAARSLTPTATPTPPSTSLPAAPPPAKLRSARALEAILEANVPAATASHHARRPAEEDEKAQKTSSSSSANRKRTDVDDCADLVRVIVMPPESFSDSVQIDMRQYDLDWVSGFRSRPPHLVTLHNFLSPDQSNAAGTRKINSPRSALVCLRNGINPSDLVKGESDAAEGPGALPTDPALREAVLRFRNERHAARRQQLLSVLLDDYLSLCGKVPQAELIHAVQNPPESHAAAEVPTSLLQRRERQRRIFEINKVRLERQLAMEQAQHEQRLAAEARQIQAEAEAAAALQAKARAEEEARAMQQARLEAQKEKNKEMEAFYQRQLEEKLAKAEEKNQQRLEAQQRLFEARREERARKEEERRERFERSARAQAELAAEVEAKRLAKAAQLEVIQEKRESRIAQERQAMLEKQARAAEAREAAKRRAEQEEEQARLAALERQAQADERLRLFQEHRQEEIAARSAEEALKDQRREQAYLEAQAKTRKFQESTLEKQLAHDAHFAEMQQQRALELAIRREQEREVMNTKAFAVLKKQRMDEYGKLRTVADLVEKRKAAEFVEQQRAAIQDAMIREREMLNAEREALRSQFGDVSNR